MWDPRTNSVWATGFYQGDAFVRKDVARVQTVATGLPGQGGLGRLPQTYVSYNTCVFCTRTQTYAGYTIVGNDNNNLAVIILSTAKNGDKRFGASYLSDQGLDGRGYGVGVDVDGEVYFAGEFLIDLATPPLTDLTSNGVGASILAINGGDPVGPDFYPLQVRKARGKGATSAAETDHVRPLLSPTPHPLTSRMQRTQVKSVSIKDRSGSGHATKMHMMHKDRCARRPCCRMARSFLGLVCVLCMRCLIYLIHHHLHKHALLY